MANPPRTPATGPALFEFVGGDLTLIAATVHTVAMLLAGAAIAWVVSRYLGLRLLRRRLKTFQDQRHGVQERPPDASAT